jgi:glycosyltransferase involved in cell wall biosynthesis
MKICLLCYRANPYSGGQGIYLKYIAEEMARQGHEVHAVVGPPYPLAMKNVKLHKIENNQYYTRKCLDIIEARHPLAIFRPLNFYEYCLTRVGAFPEISTFSVRTFNLVRRLNQQYKFDIMHDNQSISYGLLLLKYLDAPVVATIHHPLSIDLVNTLEQTDNFKKKMKTVMFYPTVMQSYVSKRLDRIITVSEDARKMIHRDFGVPLGNIQVVYNGIDRNIFRPLGKVKKKKGKIIFVGNIEDGKKGFVYLLKALTRISNAVRLTAVDGGAPHRNSTGQLIKKLGLGDRVEFTGKTSVEELVRHYNESEIAVVPSIYEGFGFPAAEAMSCGIPVIASDGGALPEVVGDAGIIVPARNDAAIADAVNELISDSKKLQEMREWGIERVKKNFTWEKAVLNITDSYRRLINP